MQDFHKPPSLRAFPSARLKGQISSYTKEEAYAVLWEIPFSLQHADHAQQCRTKGLHNSLLSASSNLLLVANARECNGVWGI